MLKEEQIAGILRELRYHTSRAGGKGGQNVNKVETKVDVEFDVEDSFSLEPGQKNLILSLYPNLIDGKIIRITSAVHRTQLQNKSEAQKKLIAALNKILKPVKKRLATKPSKASKKRRIESKKKLSEKKELRRKLY